MMTKEKGNTKVQYVREKSIDRFNFTVRSRQAAIDKFTEYINNLQYDDYIIVAGSTLCSGTRAKLSFCVPTLPVLTPFPETHSPSEESNHPIPGENM